MINSVNSRSSEYLYRDWSSTNSSRNYFMASELYNTIDALSREKGIDPQIVVNAVEDAIVVATRKYYKTLENLRAELDKETGKIRAFAVKTIVENTEQVE